MKKYFSWTLFKENLKRFWGFSAIAFVLYFLTNSFEILLNYSNLDAMAYSVTRMLNPAYFPYAFLAIAVAVISSVLVFGYLNKVNSSGVMHAMPFSRASLFITNYISGFALAILPVLLNSLLLLVISKPVMYTDAFDVLYNVFSFRYIAESFLCNVLIIFFTYAISCVAAVICGNSIIHLLTAIAFNFLVPVTYSSFSCYKDMFYYGYIIDNISDLADFHPAMKIISDYFIGSRYSCISAITVIIYVCIALALSVLAYYLYSQRKLERAGDSYVFVWVKYFIAACFTYFSATFMATILGNEKFVLGLIIGGCVGFAIGWMIISKSFRIFNTKTLKAFGISVVVTVAVVIFFMLDLTGFETKIPELSEIESADLDVNAMDYFGIDSLEDKDNLAALTQLHSYLLENREHGKHDDRYGSVSIEYTLKDGSSLSRYYDYVSISEFKDLDSLKSIFESEENNGDASSILELLGDQISISFDLYEEYLPEDQITDDLEYGSKTLTELDGKDIEKENIIRALSKDLSHRSYDDFIDGSYVYDTIGYMSIYSYGHTEMNDKGIISSYDQNWEIDGQPDYVWQASVEISPLFTNTIAALKDAGLY